MSCATASSTRTSRSASSYLQARLRLTPELVAHYDANRLTVTRQLPYDPDSTKTLDLCLFVNGIPVATAELKNQLTGQNIEHAIKQYRTDRDPKNVTLGRRALVHFAVDPDAVAMTTKLDGQATRFLPFNLGHNRRHGQPAEPERAPDLLPVGAGLGQGRLAGHPRPLHPRRAARRRARQRARSAAETVIFPRYHQWDAVLKLEADATANGAGQTLPDPALGRVGQVEHDRLDWRTASRRSTTPTTRRCSTRWS